MIFEGKQSVYLQIAESIRRDIRSGVIADGEKLPSCRELALKMGINPNTVQRAYTLLEEEGLIYTMPKKGVYARAVKAAAENIRDLFKKSLVSFKSSGLLKNDAEDILKEVYKDDRS